MTTDAIRRCDGTRCIAANPKVFRHADVVPAASYLRLQVGQRCVRTARRERSES
jgi:hypothetical protein